MSANPVKDPETDEDARPAAMKIQWQERALDGLEPLDGRNAPQRPVERLTPECPPAAAGEFADGAAMPRDDQ